MKLYSMREQTATNSTSWDRFILMNDLKLESSTYRTGCHDKTIMLLHQSYHHRSPTNIKSKITVYSIVESRRSGPEGLNGDKEKYELHARKRGSRFRFRTVLHNSQFPILTDM
mmetsp:Transcript_29798/g.54727  ORF Transcript_29798/g.54727 Transcript_29798/m.54727 type:complete len:113 (-) Transcript_29798:120-458(-)